MRHEPPSWRPFPRELPCDRWGRTSKFLPSRVRRRAHQIYHYQNEDGKEGARVAGAGPIFARKTKRPRLDLSLGTSVDQPSPKCCSRTTLTLPPHPVNGPLVPYLARTC